MSRTQKGNLLLLLTAFIWGSAFVAQSTGIGRLGPWTYNCIKNFLGTFALLPVISLRGRRQAPLTAPGKKTLWKGGILCGTILCAASMFQNYGIMYTSVGKAGFLTTLYVLMVPLFGIFSGHHVRPRLWGCVLITLLGLYFLSVQGSFTLARGDTLVLICSLGFTFHILIIDRYAPQVDGIQLSCIQFLTAAVLSVPGMIAEGPSWADIQAAAVPLLYAGLLSNGVAYTLQIVAQKSADPTMASMIMSMESVFAALSGWVILHQTLSARELLGCGLVFTAILLAQTPVRESGRQS